MSTRPLADAIARTIKPPSPFLSTHAGAPVLVEPTNLPAAAGGIVANVYRIGARGTATRSGWLGRLVDETIQGARPYRFPWDPPALPVQDGPAHV